MPDQFLMCKPKHFKVSYVINPWMDGNEGAVEELTAMKQWTELQKKLSTVAEVVGINQNRALPDMVFTANAALIHGDRAVVSRFKHAERQGEEKLFSEFLLGKGYQVLWLPDGIPFEGAGDSLFCRRHPDMLWMGYGHRSDERAAQLISEFMRIAVQPLRLMDDRFYHLDTCFCPLEGGFTMYYPAAFDELGLLRIRAMIPESFRIEVTEEDALHFACNAVNSGKNIFLNKASDELVGKLESCGFTVYQTPLSEFMKAGGSAKCLTLKLNER